MQARLDRCMHMLFHPNTSSTPVHPRYCGAIQRRANNVQAQIPDKAQMVQATHYHLVKR